MIKTLILSCFFFMFSVLPAMCVQVNIKKIKKVSLDIQEIGVILKKELGMNIESLIRRLAAEKTPGLIISKREQKIRIRVETMIFKTSNGIYAGPVSLSLLECCFLQ